VEKNMGMISNYTRRSTVCWNNVLKIIFEDSSCHSFIWEIKGYFQPITGDGGMLGTAMSCQPRVVGGPERTLNQDFASISRQASAASVKAPWVSVEEHSAE
jgi:hypothetical protein